MDICEHFGISTRHFDRLRRMGEIPAPDIRIGDTKLWSFEVVAGMFRDDPDRPSRRGGDMQAKAKGKPTAKGGAR
jgi:hypothetical protein